MSNNNFSCGILLFLMYNLASGMRHEATEIGKNGHTFSTVIVKFAFEEGTPDSIILLIIGQLHSHTDC